MDDLISKASVCEILADIYPTDGELIVPVADVHKAYDAVLALPSMGTERKKGKWIKIPGFCTPGGDPVWACSECGKGVHVYGIEHRSYQADISDDQWKACPNCGAEMTGENNG